MSNLFPFEDECFLMFNLFPFEDECFLMSYLHCVHNNYVRLPFGSGSCSFKIYMNINIIIVDESSINV